VNYDIKILSLVSNADRRAHMESVMSTLQLPYTFHNATTPNDITQDIEERLFSRVDYYDWDINQRAVMATFISHLSLLKLSYNTQTNLLILEDDIELSDYGFDLTNVDFNSFDIFNLGTQISCYAYFISWQGAYKVLDLINTQGIRKAYDWELCQLGLQNRLRYRTTPLPVWKQVDTFKSNIAPNGYKRK
jgi:GR25 family glycosyltransferase involved in LPS biosynthesis